MTIRTGMAELIGQLRAMSDAGTADTEIAGTAYWTDEQLESMLDRFRTDFRREKLIPRQEFIGGEVLVRDYFTRRANLERDDGSGTVWRITDAMGSAVASTAYTVNYDAGVIRFNTDQDGSARYLSGRSYDLYAAASEIWAHKAGHVAAYYDIDADNHHMSRSQYFEHCMNMMTFYRARSERLQVVHLVRGDVEVPPTTGFMSGGALWPLS